MSSEIVVRSELDGKIGIDVLFSFETDIDIDHLAGDLVKHYGNRTVAREAVAADLIEHPSATRDEIFFRLTQYRGRGKAHVSGKREGSNIVGWHGRQKHLRKKW